jgi:hypothetical protein
VPFECLFDGYGEADWRVVRGDLCALVDFEFVEVWEDGWRDQTAIQFRNPSGSFAVGECPCKCPVFCSEAIDEDEFVKSTLDVAGIAVGISDIIALGSISCVWRQVFLF